MAIYYCVEDDLAFLHSLLGGLSSSFLEQQKKIIQPALASIRICVLFAKWFVFLSFPHGFVLEEMGMVKIEMVELRDALREFFCASELAEC